LSRGILLRLRRIIRHGLPSGSWRRKRGKAILLRLLPRGLLSGLSLLSCLLSLLSSLSLLGGLLRQLSLMRGLHSGLLRSLAGNFLRGLVGGLLGDQLCCVLGLKLSLTRFFFHTRSIGQALRLGCVLRLSLLTRLRPLLFDRLLHTLTSFFPRLRPRCGKVPVFCAVQICPRIERRHVFRRLIRI
jgi:hypothetical protein